jgi:hypothetical protein
MRKEAPVFRRITLVLLSVAVLLLAPATPANAQNAAADFGQGHKLPLPWGIGVTLYDQTQPYKIVSLDVPLAGIDIGAAEGLRVDNEVTSYHFKFDYWLLPFLDVYLLGGYIDGSTTVKLSDVDLGLPILLNDLRVEYNGYVYGGGATLAVGGDTWFTSLTYDLTRTDLDTTDSTVQAWVLTPRIGLVFEDAVVYVGAMYQQAEESHEGIFEMPYLGQVPFSVVLEQAEDWNYVVGMSAGLSQHWVLNLEGYFGDRKSVLAALDYRFGKH